MKGSSVRIESIEGDDSTDFGRTVLEAVDAARELIELHIKSLIAGALNDAMGVLPRRLLTVLSCTAIFLMAIFSAYGVLLGAMTLLVSFQWPSLDVEMIRLISHVMILAVSSLVITLSWRHIKQIRFYTSSQHNIVTDLHNVSPERDKTMGFSP